MTHNWNAPYHWAWVTSLGLVLTVPALALGQIMPASGGKAPVAPTATVSAQPTNSPLTNSPANSPLARHYRVIELPGLGGTNTEANAINDKGQVVGTSKTRSGASHAFLYSNRRIRDLGTLDGEGSNAYDINNRGQIVGDVRRKNGELHACLWENGRQRDLGKLGGFESLASAINERGQIVGETHNAILHTHAFLWERGRMRDLGTLTGKDDSDRDFLTNGGSQAHDINEKGQVVGSSETRKDGSHAFLWENGLMKDLGGIGGKECHAYTISEDGEIVGSDRTPQDKNGMPGDYHTLVWIKGQMHDLTVLAARHAESSVRLSTPFLGWKRTQDEFQAAFTQYGRTTDLNSLINDPSWHLTKATAINAHGQIVGFGEHYGKDRPFLLVPIPAPAKK